MRLRIWHGGRVAVERPSEVAGGPDRTIERLYETEAPRLRRRLSQRFSPDQAADLVQSAFVRLLRLGAERTAQIEHPPAYLARIADNQARDQGKAAARRCDRLHVDVDDCAIPGPDPIAALEARDMLRRIEAAITGLPDRTREIFMAHRFEDLTYPEIARRMGVSVKTVEKHISLALRELHRRAGPAS